MGSAKKVDVGAVLTAGRPLALDVEVAMPDFGAYHFPAPARVVVELAPLGRGIQASGTIEAAWSGLCDRCVEAVRGDLHIDVDEQFDPAEKPQPLADNNVLDGQLLDVADLTRQLVDSSLPLSVLCSPDCPGLCPACGNRRDAGCSCPTSVER